MAHQPAPTHPGTPTETNGDGDVHSKIEKAERTLRDVREQRQVHEKTLDDALAALEKARRELREAGYRV